MRATPTYRIATAIDPAAAETIAPRMENSRKGMALAAMDEVAGPGAGSLHGPTWPPSRRFCNRTRAPEALSLIGGTFGYRHLYLAAATRHTRSELLEDVAFDGPGGQRLRRTSVPSLALGGGAGVIAITPIATANLGRRHGAAARPA